MNEEWRAVAGYEGHYEVSNFGRVRSLDRFIMQRNGVRRFFAGKILNPTIRSDSYNYWCVNLAKDTVHTFTPVHQLVCAAWRGPKPFVTAVVRHSDDDWSNNMEGNLSWGTVLDNEADKDRNGRRPRGESHGRAIETEKEVREILIMAKSGMRQRDIIAATGKPKAAIQRIVSRTTWKHLEITDAA